MAYQKQEWSFKTPIIPEKLNNIEEGISNSVDLDSDQTINGTKTFEHPIILNETPTESNHVVRLEDLNNGGEVTSVDLSLRSGYTNVVTTDVPKAYKVGKIVWLQGLVEKSAGAGTIITVLPEGYRPMAGNYNRYCVTTEYHNNTFCWVNINNRGEISLSLEGAIGAISLSGIIFITD